MPDVCVGYCMDAWLFLFLQSLAVFSSPCAT
jgi:hypothetical protein